MLEDEFLIVNQFKLNQDARRSVDEIHDEIKAIVETVIEEVKEAPRSKLWSD